MLTEKQLSALEALMHCKFSMWAAQSTTMVAFKTVSCWCASFCELLETLLVTADSPPPLYPTPLINNDCHLSKIFQWDDMEAPQLLFLFSPSPVKKEYLIVRWSSFLKQRLVTKSVALVGKKVTNSLIWGFYCTETRQRFHATRRCISLCWSENIF